MPARSRVTPGWRPSTLRDSKLSKLDERRVDTWADSAQKTRRSRWCFFDPIKRLLPSSKVLTIPLVK